MARSVVAASVVGGVVAALIDIGAAAVINRVGPAVVLRAIARGLLGRSAMTGGAPAALLGFALQLAMGALIGLIFGAAAERWLILVARWRLAGLLYGLVIFIVMEFLVVPLSAVGRVQTFTAVTLSANIAAMLLFGLIVSGTAAMRTSSD